MKNLIMKIQVLKGANVFLFLLAVVSALFLPSGCSTEDYSLLESDTAQGSGEGAVEAKRVKASVIVGNKTLQAVGGTQGIIIPSSILSIKMEVQDTTGTILQSKTKNVLVDAEPLTFEFEFNVGEVRRFFAYGFDGPDGSGNINYQGQTINDISVTEGMPPVTIGLAAVGAPKIPSLTNVTLVNSGSTATLSATINPLDSGIVAASFEWGVTSAATQPDFHNVIIESGTADIDVSHTIQGLLPGTEYFFTITAKNNERSISAINTFLTPIFISSELIFPTSPDIVSLSALNITPTSATLTTDILPNGAPSILFFDWGTTPNFEKSSSVYSLVNNLWSATAHTVTHEITGLQPGTTYYTRVTALNSESVVVTTLTQQFTTN